MNDAALTVITSTKPTVLTKRYLLDGSSVLQCTTAAQMVEGLAEQRTVSSAEEFAELLQTLKQNQALCYGLTPEPNMQMLSKKVYEARNRPAGAITRTAKSMQWPTAGGVLMIDYDPEQGAQPLTRTQLLGTLAEVVPELTTSAYVWWCSSSSLIYNEEEQLTGVKGQRVYILVKDGQDIERAGKVLFSRLWLAGHGHIFISRAGSLLERSIIDASVWQTNRLDFAAGALCITPLEQRRGKPVVYSGDFMDTAAALPDLTPEEEAEVKAAQDKAKTEADPERGYIQGLYIEEEANKLLDRQGIEKTDEALEEVMATIRRAVKGGVLAGDFLVTLSGGQVVSIGEMLDNPSKYHGSLTLDPLEPEYNGGKVVGKVYLMSGRANLYSQAHGGKNYKLIRQPRRIEHVGGAMSETSHRTLEYLKRLPDVFDMGSSLVIVQGGKAQAQGLHAFSYWLGGVAQYWTWAEKNKQMIERPIDPPAQMIQQLLAINEERKLKQLNAVISAPVITKDARVIERAGYDEKTKVYLDMQGEPLPVPSNITTEQAEQALETLMAPFRDFAVNTALDKGVLLAAILTAIQRPLFSIAPAIGLDAPVQGTGKTYLAQCLGALATGEVPPVYPHTKGRDDEEVRKRITSILMTDARAIVWDNIVGVFDSASMASLITSERYTDRILGKSENSTMLNRALILLTGNNLTLAGDMPRRVLKCRLDSQLANPTLRKFKGGPLEFIQENRQQLVQAGLTLIKAYLESEECKGGGAVRNEGAGGFDEWDQLVRQPVAWIANGIGLFKYSDPAEALKEAIASDPELEALSEALEGIEHLMGDAWFETRELYKQLDDMFHDLSTREGLKETLEDLSAGKITNSRSLGRVLGYRVGRIAGGRKLVKRSGRVAKFKVEKAEEDKSAA